MAQTETVATVNGKKITFNPNSLTTANNGLTASGGNIQFGGALTQPSILTTTSAFTLAIKGLQAGANSDNVLVVDANGILKSISHSSFGDNLGNHIATMDLDMSKKNILNIFNAYVKNDLQIADRDTNNSNYFSIYKNAGILGIWNNSKSGNDFQIDETTRKTGVNNLSIFRGTDGSIPAVGSIATAADNTGNLIWKSPNAVVGAQAWALLGNTGTTPGTNFLGTSDNQDMVVKTNNIERMRIEKAGNVGIGTISPKNKFSVSGGPLSQDDWANGDKFLLLGMTGANKITEEGNMGNGYYAGAITDVNNNPLSVNSGFHAWYTAVGGAWSKKMTLDPNGNLNFTGALKIGDLPAGVATESLLTTDASGNVHKLAAGSFGDNLGNHTATQDLVMSSKNISGAANVTASGTITGANITATTKTTTPAAQITTGAGAGKIAVSDASGNVTWTDPATITTAPVTADNGLTVTSSKVQLGGDLNKATTISTSASNTLAITGLQSGAATDNVVVSDTNGVLKTVAGSTMQIEPWQIKATTNKATANTDNIFQMGQVGIGTNNMLGNTDPNVKLAVNGAIITPTSYYADYVFEDYLDGKSEIKSEYAFKSLDEVSKFITENKHLPGVTSIKDLKRNEKGEYIFNITDLSIQSLEKIEELYLHTIEQQKQLEANDKNITEQKKQLEANEKTMKEMNNRIDSLEKLIKGMSK